MCLLLCLCLYPISLSLSIANEREIEIVTVCRILAHVHLFPFAHTLSWSNMKSKQAQHIWCMNWAITLSTLSTLSFTKLSFSFSVCYEFNSGLVNKNGKHNNRWIEWMYALYRRHYIQYWWTNLNEERWSETMLRMFHLFWNARTEHFGIVRTKNSKFHFNFSFLWAFCARFSLKYNLLMVLFSISEWFQHWSWSKWSSCQSIVGRCCWINQCNVNRFNQHETRVGGKHSAKIRIRFSCFKNSMQ